MSEDRASFQASSPHSVSLRERMRDSCSGPGSGEAGAGEGMVRVSAAAVTLSQGWDDFQKCSAGLSSVMIQRLRN